MRELITLVGPMRSGKTSFCVALFPLLAAKSSRPFAIIEENLRDPKGIPLSILLRDLGDGGKIGFASRGRDPLDASKPYPPFDFSPQAFSWAESRIKEAVRKGCGPVILDEMGPLEAGEGGGFFGIAAWLMRHGDCPLVVTVRPGLEKVFADRLRSASGFFPVKHFSIDNAPLDQLLGPVSAEIFLHCQNGEQAL
ncbi:MAG TPA: hypothetical protein VN445_15060 [Rectinemataceae bacterium]|nr:hypothetical protein [Rectinemataceae bacterium]